MLVDLLLTGLLDGARIGVAALGFALIFYTTKDLHFAYGAFLSACGYIYYLMVVDYGLGLILGAIAALAFGAVIGVLTQWLFYRKLNDELAILLFSFGLVIIVENLLHIMFGPADKVLPPSALTQPVTLLGTRFRIIDLVSVGAFLVVWAGLWYMLERRQVGLAIRAVMRDPVMSELVGIRSARIKMLAYGLGSMVAAAAGMIAVTREGIRPGAGFGIMLFAFIATLLGSGSLTQVALWSVILGVFMSLVAWPFPTELQTLLAFLAMLVYLVMRSMDLKGSLRRRRASVRQAKAVAS